MNINLCEVQNWYQLLGLIAILSFEAWLGKTPKTKSGSIIEMTALTISNIIKFLINKYKTKKGV